MKYKAIISDVDGTLIKQGHTESMDGVPSKKIVEAVTKVKEKIHFGIATSRPLFFVDHIGKLLPLSGPSIFNGGSIILDLPSQKVVWRKDIEKDATLEILSIAEKHHIAFVLHESGRKGEEITSRSGYIPKTPLNIFLTELTDEKATEIHEQLKHIPNIAIHKVPSFTRSLWGFDITHAEATKQHGVMQIAEILNIYPSEIIAIGDGYNDFPLLMSAGLKVAMGNAVEDLKAIADYIAPSIDEDGVADVIEKFVLTQ